MNTLKVGGEVDAFCTRCKMVLAHTILAMMGQKPVRVQCNTCNGQHNFRGTEATPAARAATGAAKPRAAGGSKEEKPSKVRISFDELLAQRPGEAKTYSPKTSFLMDELINHPTFGRGFVTSVRSDKIDVLFRAGTKTLVHGKA